MQKKIVQFEFLQPEYSTFGRDGNPAGIHPLPLKNFFTEIQSLGNMHHTLTEINGDLYRFQRCNQLGDGLWEIQILHLRKKVLPGSADEFGEYQDVIDLPEGRFPAESTTLLYSEKTKTLYTQRNIYGISIKNLEEYFTRLMFRPGTPEGTNRVLLTSQRKTGYNHSITGKTQYKKLILCADVAGLEECQEGGSLRDILTYFRSLGSSVAKVEISVGRRYNNRLTADRISDLINEASRYAGTTSLKATMSDSDDTSFSVVDLLEDKKYFAVEISYTPENPVTHARLMTGLRAEYQKEFGKGAP